MKEVEDKILKLLNKSKKKLCLDDILNKLDNISKKDIIKVLKELVDKEKISREVIKRKAHYYIPIKEEKKKKEIKLVNKKDISNWEKEVLEIEKLREESVLKLEDELNSLYEKKYRKLENEYNNFIKKNNLSIEETKKEIESLLLELKNLNVIRILKKRKIKQKIEKNSNLIFEYNNLLEEKKKEFQFLKENLNHKYKTDKSDMLEREYRKYLIPENPVIIEENYKRTLDKINNYTQTYYDTVDITIKCELENIIIKRKILETLTKINKYVTIAELQNTEKELLKYTNQRIKNILKTLLEEEKIVRKLESKIKYYKVNEKANRKSNKLIDYDNNCAFSKDRNEVYMIIKKHVKNNYINLEKITSELKNMELLRLLQVLYSLEQEKKIIKKCEPNEIVYFVAGGV